jgi:hypothetical protein
MEGQHCSAENSEPGRKDVPKGLKCLRENPPVQDSVPKGRLRVAQHAVLGRVYERSPVPKGRLSVDLSNVNGFIGCGRIRAKGTGFTGYAVMIPFEQMTDEQFERHALDILHRELGGDGLARFLRVYRAGTGDYTRDRHSGSRGSRLRT